VVKLDFRNPAPEGALMLMHVGMPWYESHLHYGLLKDAGIHCGRNLCARHQEFTIQTTHSHVQPALR